MGYRVAVVGATGAVGREIIKTLAERAFPVDEIAAVASARSAGQEVSFGDKQVLKVRNLDTFSFAGFDIALFSPGAAVSAVHAPRAAAEGCDWTTVSPVWRRRPSPATAPRSAPPASPGSPAARAAVAWCRSCPRSRAGSSGPGSADPLHSSPTALRRLAGPRVRAPDPLCRRDESEEVA